MRRHIPNAEVFTPKDSEMPGSSHVPIPWFKRWSSSRESKKVIDAINLSCAGRSFYIFGADALKAQLTVLVLVNGTTSILEREE